MIYAVGTFALVFLWGTQLMLRFPFFQRYLKNADAIDLRRYIRNIWIIGGIAIFLLLMRHSWLVFTSWQVDPIGQYLLPPYESIWYFLRHEFSRTWGSWLVAFIFALGGKFIVGIMNRRAGDRFFEPEEPWFFATALFFVGYPGNIFYILTLGIGALFLTLIYHVLEKGRAPLYFLWLPCALFAILITYVLIPKELLASFNF